MKTIVILVIIIFLPGCVIFLPVISTNPYNARGAFFDDTSLLLRRDDCKVVSNAFWFEGMCGQYVARQDRVTRGALIASDSQLSFLVWDGEEYGVLLEIEYDRITKLEIMRMRMPLLMSDIPRMVVHIEKGICYTFQLEKGFSKWKTKTDTQKTSEMVEFVSKKIEVEKH